jgi:hypothetical protein
MAPLLSGDLAAEREAPGEATVDRFDREDLVPAGPGHTAQQATRDYVDGVDAAGALIEP